MREKNITVGIGLIFLGIFWMFYNMGLIRWSIWSVISYLWPLIFIVLGMNIIFKDKKIVQTITWIIFFIIIIVFGLYK